MHVEETPLFSSEILGVSSFPRQAQRFIHEFAKFLTTFGGSQPQELCGFPSLSQLLCEKKMNKKMKTKSTKTVKGEDCSTSSRLEGYEIPFFTFEIFHKDLVVLRTIQSDSDSFRFLLLSYASDVPTLSDELFF